jgi:hypothetical protein
VRELFGLILACLALLSFAALVVYFFAGAAAVSTTLREVRRQRRWGADLDEVLHEILGPRSAPGEVNPRPRSS